MERSRIEVRGTSNSIRFNGNLDQAKKTVETVMESFLVPSIARDPVHVVITSTVSGGITSSKTITVRGIKPIDIKNSIQAYLNELSLVLP